MSKDKNRLSEELSDKVRYFIQDTSPSRVSKNLRVLLFGYLRDQREGLPTDLEEILNDVETLFELLEVAADERSKLM